ncbi:MAG: hypothetical protein AB2L12_09465 [Smithellaceae bacterium]
MPQATSASYGGNAYGNIYPSELGFYADKGALNRIEMATATGIAANTFVASGTVASSYTLETAAPGAVTYSDIASGGPTRYLTALTQSGLGISGYKWGVGKTNTSGTYTGDPTGDLVWSYYTKSGGTTVGPENVVYTQNAASYTAAGGGYYRGDVAGASTNWQSASTSVFGGTVKGTFDPAASGTWSATTLATRIETAAFIDLASSTAGQATLAALNIPSVIVGSVNLSGSDGNWSSLSINNMGFYASTSGGKPQIWASNNVSGTMVSVSVPLNVATHLTGAGGFAADFTVRRFDNNKWAADIKNGVGGFNGTNTFQGGAAGTYSGSSVSGTASGTAHTETPH